MDCKYCNKSNCIKRGKRNGIQRYFCKSCSSSFQETCSYVAYLIYHFKDKNALINVLHQQILESAMSINQEVKDEKNVLKGLFGSAKKGFEVLRDYRFFMIDFNYILKENKELHQQIKDIESLHFAMYEEGINQLIAAKVFREKHYEHEYADFITQIRIFSDYWLSSAQVYEPSPDLNIEKYTRLFLMLFYPYLTEQGRQDFDNLLLEYGMQPG